jgi:hypothetical protein
MRSAFSRRLACGVLASLAALGAGAASAPATRTVRIASHVSIEGKGLTFRGKVTSANSACRRGRKVTLYRAGALALGSVRTNSAGRWKITVPGSAGVTLGRFYAKAQSRSEGTAGTIYVCRPATSKTIAYTP